MDHHNQPPPRGGRQVTAKDVAQANDYFEHFLNATSLKNILGYYRSICEHLNLKPNLFPLFYPKLRAYLTCWRAKALWKKFDARAAHKCYGKGKLCSGSRVLIIGAGPCGLRTAIEAQLLGAKVVIIEKRDRLSRHNVLHLWPFVIEDLRALGAKKFFGKFCAGAIDHISIRQLQCILLKVVLLLGCEVHTEVSFERLIEPDPLEKTGWKAEFKPSNHPVSQFEFDVVIGADGKRNTLQGFKRKEFRGKLAIAITANFINKKTEAEARVEEISGVAFIFNQKFFKELYEATGIDLENIVYYKDETHYFVMTAKKASLIEKGVIKQDLADTERLLALDNVNREALMDYAIEAANFSTNYQMPDLEFAVNHYGQPDVAMFDFTSMYAAENASKVVERNGYKLLMILVGDSLLEPFWPTGSGCARGFLSSLDAAWAIRSWCSGTMTPLDVIAERESIYRLLGQTTPDNLNKEWKSYTLDPVTRYPNLNKNVVLPLQTVGLFDSDDPKSIEKLKRNSLDVVVAEVPKKRRRGNVDNEVLLNWISEQIREHDDITISDIASVFRDGKVLLAILNHYRPDLVDYSNVIGEDSAKMNQLAIDILEKEIGISPIMTGEEITVTSDYLAMATYLTQVYDSFRCEIPHIKHPKLISTAVIPRKKLKCVTLPSSIPPPPKPPALLPEKYENEKFVRFDMIPEVDTSSEISLSEISDMFHKSGDGLKASRTIVEDDSDRILDIKVEMANSKIPKRIKFEPISNTLHMILDGRGSVCQVKNDVLKFPCVKMIESEENTNVIEPEQVFNRVSDWISSHDFRPHDDQGVETNLVDGMTDITSVTKNIERNRRMVNDGLVVEERTDCVKCGDMEENENFIKNLSKFSQYLPFEKRRTRTSSPSHFSVIVEGEELELPETKKSDTSLKSLKYTNQQIIQPQVSAQQPVPRPSSRHKRHAEQISVNRQSLERKTRKRKTLERIGANVGERQKILEEIAANRNERHNKRRQQRRLQTEQFLKSMQMLQANAKPDSQPFEDYSLFVYRQTAPNFEDRVKDLEKKFTYVPDHENKLPNQTRGNTDEDFAARIKNLEEKWKEPQPAEKKPKDLLRAIGKIETSDWYIKEIEKKIRENKLGKPASRDKEKVPKWSREQFKARQTKMEKQHLDRQDSAEAKFADIDKNIKHLELKLKEGTARDLGQNKVASITEKLTSRIPDQEPKPLQKTNSRPVILPSQNTSEFCHFCGKRVYLMERLSAEGRFFHHGCFKCQYCHTQLRLGSYAFDKDGIYDHKFFCIHHYGMQGEIRAAKISRKPSQRQAKSPEKKNLSGIAGVDLLDRVRTPERIEFANLSCAASDHEESLSQMDEDEWTDKNFGASAAELNSSDESSSSSYTSDTDDEDAYEEALEEPATKEGTLKWAERFNRRYSKKRDDSDSDAYSSSDRSSYYENTSDDDDSDTATEGEEEIRARELRKQEVRVEPPVVQTDTGTDTEVKSSNLSTIPDILSDNHLRVPDSKSPCSDEDSAEFSSAISGVELDSDTEKTNNNKQKKFSLAKSATAGTLPTTKPPQRNFILPPKENRNKFGKEFVSKFPVAEPEPLLIIKRTPSKLSIPKEIGKPKVAVSANFENAKKYFGNTATKKAEPKPILKRSETLASSTKSKLVKQISLPEKSKEEVKKQELKFNFEPLEDSKEIDNYIANLLANEEELMKPVDLSKFAPQPESEESEEEKDEPVSSSIEDLLKALKTETKAEGDAAIDRKSDEKIEDLLNWIEDLEHQTEDRKTYRSLSDAKYKNLERSLKLPKRADSLVSKIPKDNIKYFERHLAGKSVEDEPPRSFALARSKTDIYCNKPRTSIDLDAVSNVDIKKVLMKFEKPTQDNNEKVASRRSFGKRFSVSELKRRDDKQNSELEDALKDFESFVGNMKGNQENRKSQDWCVNITVSSIPNPEFLGLTNESKSDFKDPPSDQKPVGISLEAKQMFRSEEKPDQVDLISPKQVYSDETSKEESKPHDSKSQFKAFLSSLLQDDNREPAELQKEKQDDSEESSSSNSTDSDSDEEPELEETMKAISDDIESMKDNLESRQSQKSEEKSPSVIKPLEPKDNLTEPQLCKFDNQDQAQEKDTDYAKVQDLNIDKEPSPKKEVVAPKPPVNLEDLYAKVNKPKPQLPPPLSPPVPRRNRKKSSEESPPSPPPRPQRQKSHEHCKSSIEPNNNEEFLPIAPQRKRANTASPLPKHKSLLMPSPGVDDTKSLSTTNLEIVSDETTSDSSSEIRNSATEISTDSEFAHDDPTPTRELPITSFNDTHVTKTRGSGARNTAPLRKIQVTSGYIQRDKAKAPNKSPKQDIELNLTPLVPSAPSIVRKPAPSLLPRTEGYALNRTQSTGGIAAKVSLELKKKYLLGECTGLGSIQKSGSASTLDTKLKSFHSNISDCQKLLKPAPEISPAMQIFCNKLNEKISPNLTPQSPKSFEPVAVSEEKQAEVINEPEGRPRSPVHETSIIVPTINWSKTKAQSDDSLSTDSVSDGEARKTPKFNFNSIPTVKIDEIPPDSLCLEIEEVKLEDVASTVLTDPPKSISSEKKTLNQPKTLPALETKDVLPEVHDILHVKRKMSNEGEKSVDSEADSIAEPATALTETELSDWARDGAVSDDLGDDFEFDTGRKRDFVEIAPKKAVIEELEHVCGKEDIKNKTIITEALNSVLSKNLDIEFMDTGTETSSDDGIVDSQNGYVLFNDEEELAEDSLNPNINEVVEAKNEVLKNTGYCIIDQPSENFGASITDLKASDLEQLKVKQNMTEHDEDSLLIVEGTTTEENTCSDSTVKNLTEIPTEKRREDPIENNNFQKKRLEEKLAKLKAEQASKQQSSQNNIDNNVEFDEHCQRLQTKFEFSNAKDSIDVRKSRRKSKDSPQKPDLIQEEKTPPQSPNITLQLSPVVRTPDVIYRKDIIEKERDVNQKLVQEMVMNKMKAENKSLERKRRRSRQFELTKSATTDMSEINRNLDDSNRNSTFSSGSSVYATPDLLSTLNQTPEQKFTPLSRPVSIHVTQAQRLTNEPTIKENPSLPDVRKALFGADFKTPVAPPRLKHEEAKRTAEKLKEEARLRARLLSNEDLGLSPEDKLRKLKEKFSGKDESKIEKDLSFLRSTEALNENNCIRSKSSDTNAASIKTAEKICKSDPNLLDTEAKKPKKKSKDKERRKSLTKLFSTLFTKKSPSGNGKSFLSRISPKAKDVSKDVVFEEPIRRNSFSDVRHRFDGSPPPVPPLPLNYTLKGTDDSSEGEHDWKLQERSSCDTLDKSGTLDSVSSLTNHKTSKGSRKVARQAQLKRHRMAQEIQRKLEETEVKTRELEERGVLVEKALRGEVNGRYSKDESELLQEWFDLMRDRTELRRYERELMVRAQELELEDRHARLQHELRERLDNNEQKTEADVEIEGSIINEMIEIVAKRDSLIALLEEDRLRYSNEDRDFEEQMLAKGLRLTPIRKTPEK